MTDILRQLEETIRRRIHAGDAEQSYVAQLSNSGLNKILEKIGEESIETILAAKDATCERSRNDLINEVADLIFHVLVMLVELDIPFNQITKTLENRMGISGIEEKATRGRKE